MNEDSVRCLWSSDDSGCIRAIAEIDPANSCRVGYRENSHLDVIVAASDFGPGRGSEPSVLRGRSSVVAKDSPATPKRTSRYPVIRPEQSTAVDARMGDADAVPAHRRYACSIVDQE